MISTKVVKVSPFSLDDEVIRQAARVLMEGGLVVIPTETVYGIAANALDQKALERLYQIKNRPKDKPFSLLIGHKHKVHELCRDIPVAAYKLMQRFWPGPLTIIMNSSKKGTVGLRMPDHPVALALITQAAVPLVCPSANISDHPAPADFSQAIKEMDGLVELAIDAGPAKIGRESSIVDLSVQPPAIVRVGAIGEDDLKRVLNSKNVLFVCTGNSCRSVMAQAYLNKLLQKQQRTDVHALSAGLMALAGTGASEEAREVMAKEGIDVSLHRSQRVTRELLDRSDIILAMEDIHEEQILRMAPETKNRLFLLKEFAKMKDGNLNISDPIGGSFEFYHNTFLIIKEAVERIMKIL
ncbi:MAG: L-threonylcarbamoyladenylate synthase [Candidatus Omnitrophica bacterium]|jgi:tRNA threonylcarbamoyl adenosine modification protein (Sua5/YciO/YrdC/YwlC family)|nr:L-threonylcarbamoyladenylate synthase [Candidatus Omnitrophota bacterium]MDD5077718.1 L-threonylcarbamoyladenylate synthase [Candidatus Omnitrophota bacterium]MDD5725067.1 L-threonylcarbamoyladenylate synthase [Candidatus Omnitrophota bacterium]